MLVNAVLVVLYIILSVLRYASCFCIMRMGVTVMETQYYASICGNMLDDGWMTCDFTSLSTVFLSYQDDER